MSVQHVRLPDGTIMIGEFLEQSHLGGYSGGESHTEIFCVLQLNGKNFIIEEEEAARLALKLAECIQACREGVKKHGSDEGRDVLAIEEVIREVPGSDGF